MAGRKLTDAQVVDLRKEAARGVTDAVLSKTYRIGFSTAGKMRTGEVRRDAGGPLTKRARRGSASGVGDVTSLSSIETKFGSIYQSWIEVKAAHAILGLRLQEIEEMISG